MIYFPKIDIIISTSHTKRNILESIKISQIDMQMICNIPISRTLIVHIKGNTILNLASIAVTA